MGKMFSCCSISVALSSFEQGVQVRILLINSNTQKVQLTVTDKVSAFMPLATQLRRDFHIDSPQPARHLIWQQ